MSAGNINPADWEALDEDCSDWRGSEGIRSEEQRVERTAMGREERVQTIKGRFPALRARSTFHLKLNRACLYRQAPQLDHLLNHST